MQLTVMNSPVRAALVGSRLSGGFSAPLAGSNSATTRSPSTSTAPAPQSCRTFRAWTASTGSYQQRNSICTKTVSHPAPRCRYALSALPSAAVQRCSPSSVITTRSAATQAEQHAQAQSSASSSASSSVLLDWNTFFNLRASRRRYTLLSSILASVGTTSVGITILATQNLETIGAQLMGLDPIVVMVLGTASCGAVGWLAWPFLGNSIWRLIHRKYKDAFAIVSIFPGLGTLLVPAIAVSFFYLSLLEATSPANGPSPSTERQRVLRSDKAVPC